MSIQAELHKLSGCLRTGSLLSVSLSHRRCSSLPELYAALVVQAWSTCSQHYRIAAPAEQRATYMGLFMAISSAGRSLVLDRGALTKMQPGGGAFYLNLPVAQ